MKREKLYEAITDIHDELVEKAENYDSDELMMTALDLGAVDIVEYDDYCEVITEANGHLPVSEGLEKAGYTVLNSETTMVPDNYVELDAEKVVKFNKMIETLEDLDDVQQVYHNVELPDEE